MEDKNDEEKLILNDGSSLPVSGTPRWNPTKEQINILEGLYRQGMRTPSADQIQEITSRLKVYGHIEGKNVFYWFQNHKARQRQRQQRQKLEENLTHFNHFFNHHHHQHYHNNNGRSFSSSAVLAPLLPSPVPACNNVTGSPLYISQPQGGVGYYPQYTSKVLLPRIPATGTTDYSDTQHQSMVMSNKNDMHQTLPLFPLHPTGILADKLENSFVSASSGNEDSNHLPLTSTELGVDHCNEGNQLLIDFFANH